MSCVRIFWWLFGIRTSDALFANESLLSRFFSMNCRSRSIIHKLNHLELINTVSNATEQDERWIKDIYLHRTKKKKPLYRFLAMKIFIKMHLHVKHVNDSILQVNNNIIITKLRVHEITKMYAALPFFFCFFVAYMYFGVPCKYK